MGKESSIIFCKGGRGGYLTLTKRLVPILFQKMLFFKTGLWKKKGVQFKIPIFGIMTNIAQ